MKYFNPGNWKHRGFFKFPLIIAGAIYWAYTHQEVNALALIPAAYLYFVIFNNVDEYNWEHNPYRYLRGADLEKHTTMQGNIYRAWEAEDRGDIHEAAYYRSKNHRL